MSKVALYNKSDNTLLLSGDVESNPGPITNASTCTSPVVTSRGGSEFLFNYRLLRHGLKHFKSDFGGGGDCFFKSVSHQLYDDSYHHLEIRAAGVHHISTFSALVESSTNQVDTERGIEW